MCMIGITSNDIYQITVIDYQENTAATLVRNTPEIVTISSSSSAIITSYIVYLIDSSNSYSYSSLSTQLSTAVTSGLFDTYLNTTATEYGAIGFLDCTSNYTLIQNLASTQTTNNDNHKKTSTALPVGAIVGIVLAGVVSIAILIYCYLIQYDHDDVDDSGFTRILQAPNNNSYQKGGFARTYRNHADADDDDQYGL
jgi:hypothetical protein